MNKSRLADVTLMLPRIRFDREAISGLEFRTVHSGVFSVCAHHWTHTHKMTAPVTVQI